MTDIDAEIAALEKEVSEHGNAMRDAERRLHEARGRKAGIQVGDTVLHKGKPFRVNGVRFWGSGKPWIYGNPQRRGGSWSEVNRNIYEDWEHVQSAEAQP